ncbi:hypothetical protein [Stenotrophomonas sp. PD6]|uniref:hypothetical protein n=1 Tax=Stenotrophomonas sp. PD6 TaxID=3368612 RepID=UPI003BA086FA
MSAGEELLELAEQGDERAVKRAYARLLRCNRPDDDPDAFQDLHACYQHALAMCRSVPEEQSDAPPALHLPVPDVGTPAVARLETTSTALDPEVAALDILQQAAVVSAASLSQLLQERALGWSLKFRGDVGWALLERLHHERPPVSEANFGTLMQAFDWDDIALDLDALWLATVARRCRQAWKLLPESRGALRIDYERFSERYLSAQETDEAVARLHEPRPRWRNRLDATLPTRARDTPFMLAALEYWPEEEVPTGLDPGQVGFWARFGDASHPVRLRYGALRCAIVGLFLGAVTAWGVNASPAVGVNKGWLFIATATLMVPAGWLLVLGFKGLLRWQCVHEDEARGPAWLRWAFLPLAAVAVGAAMWAQRAQGIDGLLLMTLDRAWVFGLALIAMTRARVRGPDPEGEPNALPLVAGVIWPLAGIGMSLVFWAIDLRRNLGNRRG